MRHSIVMWTRGVPGYLVLPLPSNPQPSKMVVTRPCSPPLRAEYMVVAAVSRCESKASRPATRGPLRGQLTPSLLALVCSRGIPCSYPCKNKSSTSCARPPQSHLVRSTSTYRYNIHCTVVLRRPIQIHHDKTMGNESSTEVVQDEAKFLEGLQGMCVSSLVCLASFLSGSRCGGAAWSLIFYRYLSHAKGWNMCCRRDEWNILSSHGMEFNWY